MSLLTQSTVVYQPRWSFAWWHDTVCCHLMCWNHESVKCWALFISCFADQNIKCFITTHTLPFNDPFPGLPRWAGTRKVKPIWIYWSKRQWVAVASAGPHASLYLAPDTTPAPHHSVFYRPDAVPAAQPTASKHWRHKCFITNALIIHWRHDRMTFSLYGRFHRFGL